MLEEKERKVILYLIIALLLNCLIYFLVSGNLKNAYYSRLERYSTLRRSVLKLNMEIDKRKFELLKWQKAEKDIENLRKNYFYPSQNGIEIVRKVLEKLAKEKGIYINEINYSYKVHEKEKIGEIGVSFSVEDDYLKLKDFILGIETEPKFIVVKKVDLIGTENLGIVKSKLHLSAYTNEK